MNVEVPVILIDQFGAEIIGNPLYSPCIRCNISSRLDGGVNAKPLFAMLDSGAMPCAIDIEIADSLGLQPSSYDTIHTAENVNLAPQYKAFMFIAGLKPLEINLAGTNHRRAGHPYDLILGRSFLTLFDFGFDRRNGVWSLSHPIPHA